MGGDGRRRPLRSRLMTSPRGTQPSSSGASRSGWFISPEGGSSPPTPPHPGWGVLLGEAPGKKVKRRGHGNNVEAQKNLTFDKIPKSRGKTVAMDTPPPAAQGQWTPPPPGGVASLKRSPVPSHQLEGRSQGLWDPCGRVGDGEGEGMGRPTDRSGAGRHHRLSVGNGCDPYGPCDRIACGLSAKGEMGRG